MNNKITYGLNKFHYLFIFFILYAFFGWIIETIYAYYIYGSFIKRGFLYGPICPIYGFGAIIMIVFLHKYEKSHIKLFFMAFIIFSIFEYFVSYGLEALFSSKWWDYSKDFCNINSRVSIFYSIFWGIISLLFIHYIQPIVKKYISYISNKIPQFYQVIFIYIIIVVGCIDIIFSFIKYIKPM